MVFSRHRDLRRSLLKIGGLGILAFPTLSVSDVLGINENQSAAGLPKIGLQLFSVRKELKSNIDETLQMISFIGYSGVETTTLTSTISDKEISKSLKKNKLEVMAMHIDLPSNDAEKDRIIQLSKEYKCNRIIWHGFPDKGLFKSEEEIIKLAQKCNRANQFARSNKMIFGIHNHWWEFNKLDNGKIPFDIFIEHLDKNIFFEIDAYWIAITGVDPVEVIKKLSSRVPIIHLKDGPVEWSSEFNDPYPDPMLALGTGKLNIPAIIKASGNNAEWIVLELEDCKTDMIQAVYESYNYLSGKNLGSGTK